MKQDPQAAESLKDNLFRDLEADRLFMVIQRPGELLLYNAAGGITIGSVKLNEAYSHIPADDGYNSSRGLRIESVVNVDLLAAK